MLNNNILILILMLPVISIFISCDNKQDKSNEFLREDYALFAEIAIDYEISIPIEKKYFKLLDANITTRNRNIRKISAKNTNKKYKILIEFLKLENEFVDKQGDILKEINSIYKNLNDTEDILSKNKLTISDTFAISSWFEKSLPPKIKRIQTSLDKMDNYYSEFKEIDLNSENEFSNNFLLIKNNFDNLKKLLETTNRDINYLANKYNESNSQVDSKSLFWQ